MKLQAQSALITGASRGVGAATALQLAQAGCRVAINYHQSADRAQAVATQCREAGVEAIVIQGRHKNAKADSLRSALAGF